MLTFFAIPKHFRGLTAIIQRNAIKSWTFLKPCPEIILFGGEEGTAEIAAELGLVHISEVTRNTNGTPLANDLFKKAQQRAENDLLCYINADIILLEDFFKAVEMISLERFLMIGQRVDLDYNDSLDFSSKDWINRLRKKVKEEGKLHGHTGIDYIVFPRGLYREIPPFALGRTMWDNWLVYKARSLGVQVVDATSMATVIHQNHDYSHHPGLEAGIWNGAEAEKNKELAGGLKYEFTIKDATLVLGPGGLEKPKLTRNLLYRRIETLQTLRPFFRFLSIIAKDVYLVWDNLRNIFRIKS